MERLSHLCITHIACMTLCMFLSSWQCCDEHVFIFLVVLRCACFYLLGSVVMSECVHAVKVRDISKGKRIPILGKYLIGSVFMQYLSFFCFGKILQFCEVRRYICSLLILSEDRHTGLWHLSLLKTFGKCYFLSMFNHKLIHFGVIRFTVEMNPKIRNGIVLYLDYAWICFVS